MCIYRHAVDTSNYPFCIAIESCRSTRQKTLVSQHHLLSYPKVSSNLLLNILYIYMRICAVALNNTLAKLTLTQH